MRDVDKLYRDDGSLQFERHYKDGVPHGPDRIWYANGKLAQEIMYDMYVPVYGKKWDEQGNLTGWYEFIDGTGIELQWYPNGNIKLERQWVNGKTTGRCSLYWDNGHRMKDTYYLYGSKVSKKRYLNECEKKPNLPRYGELVDATTKASPPKKRATYPASKHKSAKVKKSDDRLRKLINQDSVCEARDWLIEPNTPERTLGELVSRDESLEIVNQFYDCGAVQVTVIDIDGEEGEEQNSSRLIIELPKAVRRRKKVLALCNEYAENLGYDPEPDLGQGYALVMLD